MYCNGRLHELTEIYRNGYSDDIQTVVRWCANCSAIVIDEDLDGRTAPGAFMKMRFPTRSKTNA